MFGGMSGRSTGMADLAAIPSAVVPHNVERVCPLVSRWSAQLDERPGHQGARLLGSAWDDGRRDGSPHLNHERS